MMCKFACMAFVVWIDNEAEIWVQLLCSYNSTFLPLF
jgi:hypothetical protein